MYFKSTPPIRYLQLDLLIACQSPFRVRFAVPPEGTGRRLGESAQRHHSAVRDGDHPPQVRGRRAADSEVGCSQFNLFILGLQDSARFLSFHFFLKKCPSEQVVTPGKFSEGGHIVFPVRPMLSSAFPCKGPFGRFSAGGLSEVRNSSPGLAGRVPLSLTQMDR